MLVLVLVLTAAILGDGPAANRRADAATASPDEEWDRPAWEGTGPAERAIPWGLLTGPAAATTCAAGAVAADIVAIAGLVTGIRAISGDTFGSRPSATAQVQYVGLFAVLWLALSSGPTALMIVLADVVGATAGAFTRLSTPRVVIRDIAVTALLSAPALLGALVGSGLILGVMFMPGATTTVALTAWAVGLGVLAVSGLYWVVAVLLVRPLLILGADLVLSLRRPAAH